MKKSVLILMIAILAISGSVFAWTLSCSTTWQHTLDVWVDCTSGNQTTASSQTLYQTCSAPTCSDGSAVRMTKSYDSNNNGQVALQCDPDMSKECCLTGNFLSSAGGSYHIWAHNESVNYLCGPTNGKLSTASINCSGS